jgi:hypothetical protein
VALLHTTPRSFRSLGRSARLFDGVFPEPTRK